MKKLIGFSLGLLFSTTVLSQTKNVELFDLLSSVSLPKTETANTLTWKSLSAQSTTIKWKEKAPVKVGTGLQQSGTAMVLIDGKKFVCEDEIGGKKANCEWDISFQGKAAGYDRIGISATNFPVNEPGSEIKMLFPNHAASFKLLSKCIDGAAYWINMYEVKMPGRKTVWMVSTYESMSATASQYESSGVANNFYVGFYFSRKMAEDNCAN